ncbi:MAG: AbrB/MazE/SpoVT family DNA-binding domain-containing protein [Leptospirales bacterium]
MKNQIKSQITIPARIAEAVNIKPDDMLEISCSNGVVTLVTVDRKDRKQFVMDYAGIARGLWERQKTKSELP